MFGEIIYSNEHITLILLNTDVMLLVKKPGYSIDKFQKILTENPRIKITEFAALKNALNGFENRTIAIGIYRESLELLVSKDRLKAYIKIYASDEEFKDKGKDIYLDEIIELARSQNIIYGLEWEMILDKITNHGSILIASGKLPQNGQDAIINMYKLKDLKPSVSEDDKLNFYEMDLINHVQKNEWVGERIEPTEGIPGRTIFGEVIPSFPGMQKTLNYDSKSIYEVYDKTKGITKLLSKQAGVINYYDDIIKVDKLLTISEDVSYETGSIDFDGSVEVKGTIEDNFSVRASQDIQILGDIGVGAIDTIQSHNGNVYIRGGIAGRDRAKIICNGNLYTKFASNCIIECSGTVNIGYYAINCTIRAKEVLLESRNSRIIGGKVEGLVRIEVGTLGSPMGTRAFICVKGFKRSDLKKQFDYIENSINKIKDKLSNIKKKLAIYGSSQKLNVENRRVYNLLLEENERHNRTLRILVDERSKCLNYFKIKGEGEIFAKKSVYSNVLIQIKEEKSLITDSILHPMIYYYSDHELKSI